MTTAAVTVTAEFAEQNATIAISSSGMNTARGKW